MLYHSIGTVINSRKSWGNKFVKNLAADIKRSLPGATGYSVRNLKYMAKFAATYSDKEFVQQAVAQIPWGHNVVILDKVVCVYRTEEDNSITIETENTIYHLEKCYS